MKNAANALKSEEALVLYRNATQEITTDQLEINRKKICFGNTVYQTSSIVGFSAATIKNKFPWIWCLLIALFFFFIDKDPLIIKLFPDNLLTVQRFNTIRTIFDVGIILIFIIVIWVWIFSADRYGLLILSNVGLNASITIIHNNRQFINSVVETLTKNIDNDYHNAYRIDFTKNIIHQI
ncbi:hypothetical protein [Herpetosiphon llansteffanensis]|uniref:hypothetical protein n=1 Tax=Herpetosiphon llansteffanensis TaxID=2094568 RepID=UPI000D7C8EF2|nr:hypothetical protein [Herpetosiphon llansteffanensis]